MIRFGALFLLLNLASAGEKPNLLFFLADDVTYNLIGCYGGKDAKTPHIDRLASEGVRFTRAYCAEAMCAPFRAELYTGRYPVRNGCAYNHTPCKIGTQSVCQYLHKEGYRVGIIGKIHVKPKSVFPFEVIKGRGFDCKEVQNFITRDETEPFCLFVGSNNAHAPWPSLSASRFKPTSVHLNPLQHDNLKTREVTARYLAEVEALDREVGAVMAMIDTLKKRESTLFMFSSEQGWPLGFAKWSNWDLGVHTALLARWPGKIKAGRVSDALVQRADVLPTFIEAAGGTAPEGELDGQSFYKHLLGQAQPMRKYVYGVHNNFPEGAPYPVRSIRDHEYHYIWNMTPDKSYHEKHVMAKNSRLIWWLALQEVKDAPAAAALLQRFHTRPSEELYKVDADPFEQTNLATNPEYAAVKKRLRTEIERMMEQQQDSGIAMDTKEVVQAYRKANGWYTRGKNNQKKKQTAPSMKGSGL